MSDYTYTYRDNGSTEVAVPMLPDGRLRVLGTIAPKGGRWDAVTTDGRYCGEHEDRDDAAYALEREVGA